jgi:hypothetical protein
VRTLLAVDLSRPTSLQPTAKSDPRLSAHTASRTRIWTTSRRNAPPRPTAEKRRCSTADRWLDANRTLPPGLRWLRPHRARVAAEVRSGGIPRATLKEGVANVKPLRETGDGNYANPSSSTLASRKSAVSNPSVNLS